MSGNSVEPRADLDGDADRSASPRPRQRPRDASSESRLAFERLPKDSSSPRAWLWMLKPVLERLSSWKSSAAAWPTA